MVDSGQGEQHEIEGSSDTQGVERRAPLDRALSEFQREKINFVGRAAVSVPSFAAVAPFLQLSDMLAILPRRLAMLVAANAPLSLLEPPLHRWRWISSCCGNQSAEEDRGLQWLVTQVLQHSAWPDSRTRARTKRLVRE